MAITTYPLNNITYDAEDAELFHCTRRSGVFMGSSGNTEYSDFDATVTGSSRAITIQPGLAWIRNGRFKGKAVCVDAPVSITLGASNATYPRYDAIVLRFLPSTNASQLISVQGGASSNPSRPTPVRAENGTYDLHLYHVYRPAGSSVVTSADVEDMRADLNYCGYMVDDVSAFDEGKFLARENYDPTESVAKAGGIVQYVQTNAPKTPVSTSVTSTSTTTAASSSAVKSAYDLAKNAIPINQKGAANGVATLDENGEIPESQISGIVLSRSCAVNTSQTYITISGSPNCVCKQYGDLTFFDFFVAFQINEVTDDNTYTLYCTNLTPPSDSSVVSIPFITTDYRYMGIAYLSKRSTTSTLVKLKFVGEIIPGSVKINVGFNGFYVN